MTIPMRSFQGTVLSGHKAQCAVEVPFDPGVEWGLAFGPVFPGRNGYRVRASLGAGWFESAVVPRMKRWWLLIEAGRLDAVGVGVGQAVTVRMEALDEAQVARGGAGLQA
jgi:hypothetical protein